MASSPVVPQNPTQQNAATQAPAPTSAPTSATEEVTPKMFDGSKGEPVNLHKAYALLNERIAEVFDASGIKRSFTVPYVDGQSTDEHVQAVGQAASQSGGLTGNLLTTAHHSKGKGWGTGDGHTVGHPVDKLRVAHIAKDFPPAIAALSAARSLLDKIGSLVGNEDKAVKTAKNQLQFISKTNGSDMTVLDFGVALQQIVAPPIQSVARAHSGAKSGGHAPQLRGPRE
jgi:hypothetical protein